MILEDQFIWAIVLTLVVLMLVAWLWDKACRAFWRWWRSRPSFPSSAYRGPGYQPYEQHGRRGDPPGAE